MARLSQLCIDPDLPIEIHRSDHVTLSLHTSQALISWAFHCSLQGPLVPLNAFYPATPLAGRYMLPKP
jgi:hypothetical protein